jgi:hypothetical protein
MPLARLPSIWTVDARCLVSVVTCVSATTRRRRQHRDDQYESSHIGLLVDPHDLMGLQKLD